jgi:hypothetical protein
LKDGDETKPTKQKFYTAWQAGRPWLLYDNAQNVMFCAACRKYAVLDERQKALVKGTDTFKVETIKYHEESKLHQRCMEKSTAGIHQLGRYSHENAD